LVDGKKELKKRREEKSLQNVHRKDSTNVNCCRLIGNPRRRNPAHSSGAERASRRQP